MVGFSLEGGVMSVDTPGRVGNGFVQTDNRHLDAQIHIHIVKQRHRSTHTDTPDLQYLYPAKPYNTQEAGNKDDMSG